MEGVRREELSENEDVVIRNADDVKMRMRS